MSDQDKPNHGNLVPAWRRDLTPVGGANPLVSRALADLAQVAQVNKAIAYTGIAATVPETVNALAGTVIYGSSAGSFATDGTTTYSNITFEVTDSATDKVTVSEPALASTSLTESPVFFRLRLVCSVAE